MHERMRSGNGFQPQTNLKPLVTDLGPKKSMVVMVIVVGCFAVLWPKVFQPIFFGTSEDFMKPNAADRNDGCCDVLVETDMSTIRIMSELCRHIIHSKGEPLRNHKAIVSKCREEVLQTCGIDISVVLEDKIRLGISVKQMVNEVRSLNGSLCLKYNFGVAPWTIGVPHKIASKYKPTNVRQERPPHLRPEMVHPAFRERGSHIPPGANLQQGQRTPPRIIEGRPGPIPGMRPPMGGAGGVVPPSTKGSSMGIIMPIYTIGIVVFFTYTLMKLLFKKQSDNVTSLYPPVTADSSFRQQVFENQSHVLTSSSRNENNSKIGWKERDAIVNAMSALLDEVDEELEARRKAAELQSNIDEVQGKDDPDAVEIKVFGMETSACRENGHKWNPATMPPQQPIAPPPEISEPPQEIYLEGDIPANTKILVSDAITERQTASIENDPAVVLAGKMTLSVIGVAETFEAEKAGEEEVESKYTTASAITAAEQDSLADSDPNDPLNQAFNGKEGDDTDDENIEDLRADE